MTCGGNPGQLYYEDIDAQTYADWGIDYLKSDNCASYALDSSVRFAAMRDALNRTGKSIVLSIEPFAMTPDAELSSKVSNLWRVAMDIQSDWHDIINRADISDKWAPLAGPGGWNDPDMINVGNPSPDGDKGGHMTLGESRVYFGLWAIMKAPLLLSSNLPHLVPEVIAIVNNTDIIAVNQDPLGVQARKLYVDGTPLPWLVGLQPCGYSAPKPFNRGLQSHAETDSRMFAPQPLEQKGQYQIRSLATNRCLSAALQNTKSASGQKDHSRGTVVLMPCNPVDSNQTFVFSKGINTVSSLVHAKSNLALAVSNATLNSAMYGKDALAVPSAAYGQTDLLLVTRYDQDACASRDCENYDNTQVLACLQPHSLLLHGGFSYK